MSSRGAAEEQPHICHCEESRLWRDNEAISSERSELATIQGDCHAREFHSLARNDNRHTVVFARAKPEAISSEQGELGEKGLKIVKVKEASPLFTPHFTLRSSAIKNLLEIRN